MKIDVSRCVDLRTCMMTFFFVKQKAKFSSKAEGRELMESQE